MWASLKLVPGILCAMAARLTAPVARWEPDAV